MFLERSGREKQKRRQRGDELKRSVKHLVPMVGKSMGLADPGREPRLARGYPLF